MTWSRLPDGPWTARESHTALALIDEDGSNVPHMYVVAGKDESGYLNDVWKSTVGTEWIQVRGEEERDRETERQRDRASGYGYEEEEEEEEEEEKSY